MVTQKSLSQLFLLVFIIGLSYLLSSNLIFMMDAVLGAVIMAILSVKPINFLVRRGIKQSKAEWIYFIASMLVVVVPLIIIISVIKNQFQSILDFVSRYKESLTIIGTKVNEKFGINLVNEELLKTVAIKLSAFLPTVLNSTIDTLTTLGVMYFLLYFFIKEGSAMRQGVLGLLPVQEENRKKLFHLIYQSILSNAVMVPVVAFVQAIFAWIGYLIIGTNNSFIWFVATFFLAMLPFFGAALVYIPLGVLTYFSGQEASGVFIVLWGAVIVSSSDNVLRMYLMKKFDNTHPLVTFLGVLAGLNIFGFLGIIYGPLLISLLLILIKIYREEYSK